MIRKALPLVSIIVGVLVILLAVRPAETVLTATPMSEDAEIITDDMHASLENAVSELESESTTEPYEYTADSDCAAPCIFADEYGYAGIRTEEHGDIVSIESLKLTVSTMDSIFTIFGYELDELTEIEIAEWSHISVYLFDQHHVGCNGSRELSYDEIASLQNIRATDIIDLGEDLMSVCELLRSYETN